MRGIARYRDFFTRIYLAPAYILDEVEEENLLKQNEAEGIDKREAERTTDGSLLPNAVRPLHSWDKSFTFVHFLFEIAFSDLHFNMRSAIISIKSAYRRAAETMTWAKKQSAFGKSVLSQKKMKKENGISFSSVHRREFSHSEPDRKAKCCTVSGENRGAS